MFSTPDPALSVYYILLIQGIRRWKNFVVDDCFTEMLSCWLKRPTPPPSWSELKEALNSPVIGRGDIANEITGDIKTDTDTNSAVQGWNVLQTLCVLYHTCVVYLSFV